MKICLEFRSWKGGENFHVVFTTTRLIQADDYLASTVNNFEAGAFGRVNLRKIVIRVSYKMTPFARSHRENATSPND